MNLATQKPSLEIYVLRGYPSITFSIIQQQNCPSKSLVGEFNSKYFEKNDLAVDWTLPFSLHQYFKYIRRKYC